METITGEGAFLVVLGLLFMILSFLFYFWMFGRVEKNSLVLIRGLLNKVNKEYDSKGIPVRWCQNHIRWIEVKLDFKITDVNRKLNVKNLFASDGNPGGPNNDEQPRKITKTKSFIDKVGMKDIKVEFSPADAEQGMPPVRERKFPDNNKTSVQDVTGARPPNMKSAPAFKDASAKVIFAKEIEAHRRA